MSDTSAPARPLAGLGESGWPLALAPAAYALALAAIGDLRAEHTFLAALVCLLWAASRTTRGLLRELFPALIVVMAYDALRYLRPLFVTADRVAGCGLRALELSLFSVAPGMTAPDWFAVHHAPWADLFFAIPYAGFLYVAIAFAIMLYFRDRQRMRLFILGFSGMFLIAFTVWIIMPSAPPWYLQAHGCVIDLTASPSPAALARVDDALGVAYFHDFYKRGPNAFGAMPSLHNAFPMLGLLVTWRIAGWKERLANALYVLWMFVGSLYLDHHWALDGLGGWASASVAVSAGALILRARTAPAPAPRP